MCACARVCACVRKNIYIIIYINSVGCDVFTHLRAHTHLQYNILYIMDPSFMYITYKFAYCSVKRDLCGYRLTENSSLKSLALSILRIYIYITITPMPTRGNNYGLAA